MNNELFKQYLELMQLMETLEKRKEDLQIKMFDLFDNAGKNELQTPYGHFFRMSKKSWEYSPKIAEMQKKLSQEKKVEENDGTALLKTDRQYVRLVRNK